MKTIIYFLVFLVFCNFVSAGFVEVDGDEFMLDGEEFEFLGTNAYYLWYADTTCMDPGFNQGCMTPLLDEAERLGLQVIRTWGFCEGRSQDGYCFQKTKGEYDEATFRQLDRVIEEAAERDLKLIITLVDNWNYFGGMDTYNSWYGAGSHDNFYTDENVKTAYKDYVNYMLNRVNTRTGVKYKDDPTIMAWELANEPRSSDFSGDVINNWIGEMSDYIKEIDTNHLVTTGVDGGYQNKGDDIYAWWYQGNSGQDFFRNHAWDSIDFATFHYYVEEINLDMDTWVREHIRDAQDIIGKPVVLGEYGSETDKVGNYEAFFDIFNEEDINGALFWMLADDAFLTNNDPYFISCPRDENLCEDISEQAKKMGGEPVCDETVPCGFKVDGQICRNFNNLGWAWYNPNTGFCDSVGDYGTIAECAENKYVCGASGWSVYTEPIDDGVYTSDCVAAYSGMKVDGYTKLCKGTYYLWGSIEVDSYATLDCGGARLIAASDNIDVGVEIEEMGIGSSVINCKIDGFNTGIRGWHGADLHFAYNTLTNCYEGITLHDIEGSRLLANSFIDNNKGVRVWWGSNGNEIADSVFEENTHGVFLDWFADYNVITRNVFNDNYFGIRHQETGYGESIGNHIVDNDFDENDYAINLGASQYFEILNNDFNNNNYGVWLKDSIGIVLSKNRFIDNGWQAYDSSVSTMNVWSKNGVGNQWGDYDDEQEGCHDLNGNNFCDLYYHNSAESGTVVDHYPLIIPNGCNANMLCNAQVFDFDTNAVYVCRKPSNDRWRWMTCANCNGVGCEDGVGVKDYVTGQTLSCYTSISICSDNNKWKKCNTAKIGTTTLVNGQSYICTGREWLPSL